MFGCLRRIGCLVLLLVLGLGAWLARDLWWERVTGRRSGPPRAWVPAEPAQAPAVRRRIQALEKGEGEVFATFTPVEVGALVAGQAGGRLPSTVQDVETSVQGDAVSIRASLDLTALRSVESLGPVAALLTGRQRITLTGRPRVADKGRGAFEVTEVKVGGVEVPGPAISALLRELDRGTTAAPPGAGALGRSITFPLPPYVGDIRVARGRVILYKSIP